MLASDYRPKNAFINSMQGDETGCDNITCLWR
jgi:hypothetical protein